jgi:predicted lysophospholipase L1 biosynthesis ABC-type transport system permease subunit
VWPGEDPIGKRLALSFDVGDPTWLTVVGVARDVRQLDWAARPAHEVYVALAQTRPYLENPAAHFAYLTLVARADGDLNALLSAIRGVVRELSPNATVSDAATMQAVVDEAMAQPRFYLVLLAAFAVLALVLAAVGIYGVMSYAVSRRTHEIGIRMALGARETQVLRLVVGQALVQAGVGALVGLAASLLLARVMASLLYGVTPTDPATLVTVTLLLALVSVLASLAPARRAARIDPVIALRNE